MNLYFVIGLVVFTVVNLLVWRKVMSTTGTTSATLVATATALASAANAMAATATAIETLITSLKSGQLIDQPTLDSVNASLATSLASVQASQTALQGLVPTTPPAPGA